MGTAAGEEPMSASMTERDLVIKSMAENIRPSERKAREIMNCPICYVPPETPVDQAIRKMLSMNIRRLPIMEEEKLIGIVTNHDLIQEFPILHSIVRPECPEDGSSATDGGEVHFSQLPRRSVISELSGGEDLEGQRAEVGTAEIAFKLVESFQKKIRSCSSAS